MNEYLKLKERQQKETNSLPFGYAFGDAQFEKMMKKWGLDAKLESDVAQVAYLFSGVFIQKKDIPQYRETMQRHHEELEAAIKADATGDGFIYDMFYYELCNHEYGYTGDCEDALSALGLTIEEVQENGALRHGLRKAARKITDDVDALTEAAE